MKKIITLMLLCSSLNLAATKMDITGLDKIELVKALYATAKYPDIGPWSKYLKDEPLSNAAIRSVVESKFDIDYLNGKSMKINLSGNAVDTFLYNRENGTDLAEKVIMQLKQKKQ